MGEPSEYASIIPDTHEYWLELINGLSVKAFAEVTVSPRWVDGALAILFTSGLGGMKVCCYLRACKLRFVRLNTVVAAEQCLHPAGRGRSGESHRTLPSSHLVDGADRLLS